MSEALSPIESQDHSTMAIPQERENESAEIIHLEQEGNYRAVATLLEHLIDDQEQVRGVTLAARIETLLDPQSTEMESSSERLQNMLHTNDVFDDEQLYERKVQQDKVFSRLVEIMQETKAKRDLRDQRHAALRLIELRAASPNDETDLDPAWLDVIDRLFR